MEFSSSFFFVSLVCFSFILECRYIPAKIVRHHHTHTHTLRFVCLLLMSSAVSSLRVHSILIFVVVYFLVSFRWALCASTTVEGAWGFLFCSSSSVGVVVVISSKTILNTRCCTLHILVSVVAVHL